MLDYDKIIIIIIIIIIIMRNANNKNFHNCIATES